MNEPLLPNYLRKFSNNGKKLSSEQIDEMKIFRASHTGRETAKKFNVGKTTVDRYCNEGFAEKERQWNERWRSLNKDKVRLYNLRTHQRIRELKKKLFPEEMKEAGKKVREHYGKDYFRQRRKEFLERNPDYYKNHLVKD